MFCTHGIITIFSSQAVTCSIVLTIHEYRCILHPVSCLLSDVVQRNDFVPFALLRDGLWCSTWVVCTLSDSV